MLAAAVALLARPLLRTAAAGEGRGGPQGTVAAIVLLLVPVLAIGLYVSRSTWDWHRTLTPGEIARQELLEKASAAEKLLRRDPRDLSGWLRLGQDNTQLGRFPQAVDAFEHAYALSHGEDIDALTGLGEALALNDEAALDGRAGELFERALQRAPTQPKALWYGSIAAIRAGKLQVARERMRGLLAQHPPPAIRGILERQIQDLNEQTSVVAPVANTGPIQERAAATVSRRIHVSVTLDPDLAKRLPAPAALFILARDPQNAGPPLAVVRRSSSELPLKVELSESDAMLPTRTIASVPRVQLVARISSTGSPQAQKGDLYGEIDYTFTKDPDPEPVQIKIDSVVP
jgi:cytochrome c-type biogenesis protein CcmH